MGELASEIGLLNRELNRQRLELSTANERLRELLRFKAFFTAGLSHDMKNPLHALLCLAALLELGPDRAQLGKYAEVLRSNGEFLSRLIGNFLDFSRLEAGKLEVVNAPFSLQVLLADVHAAFQLRPKPGVTCTFEIADGVPDTLVGDAFRIRQILVNLVGNALKVTDAGEVRTTVSVWA